MLVIPKNRAENSYALATNSVPFDKVLYICHNNEIILFVNLNLVVIEWGLEKYSMFNLKRNVDIIILKVTGRTSCVPINL